MLVCNLGAASLAALFMLSRGIELAPDLVMVWVGKPWILGTFTAVQGLGLVAACAFILRLWGARRRQGFACRGARSVHWVGASIVGASIGFFSGWVSQELILRFPDLDGGHLDLIADLVTEGSLLSRLPILAAVLVFAPLTEELVFRGALWRFLSDSWGRGAVLVLTSLLFAAYHWNPAHIVGIVPTAFFLGGLRASSGSIGPCVLAHAVNNTLGVTLLLTLGAETPMPSWLALLALIVASLGLGLSVRARTPG